MNLHSMLAQRAAADNAVRVGVIGAGKFGSMYLSQAPRTAGIHVLGVADLAPDNARAALDQIGWPESQYVASSFDEARTNGTTFITENAEALIAAVDVVVDSTGSPAAGVRHALLACAHGTHIIMVNVEADVLAGPLLAEKAAAAGIVYSMAYGDQPALICEMIDWARSCGFEVICAGKGTKYLPHYHSSTPGTVWDHYGIRPEQAAEGGMNPKMFNSFLDGTKSGIEMAAVVNATGLAAPKDGLMFPACGVQDLAHILRPRSDGGVLAEKGTVEVISSEERDGRHVVGDLRWGVYVTFEAPNDYVERCFAEYGLMTDETGRYSAMYKPFHLIGLELGISVASAALRGEPTGAVTGWRGDVVATAKRDLKVGEVLDGEGGYTVWGKLMRSEDSLSLGGLPIGLAHDMTLKTPVTAGQPVCWADVTYDENDSTVRFRREMETRDRRNARAAE
ncbi:MAG: flagellar biosynthesis protein FlgA [Rhodospirillaceae bacterium]|jgi:predicted homoserine dehydrogenase-like protein|nr:flagellar biosynthesis protein FlgA [Rhodospirillaceae bacterium]